MNYLERGEGGRAPNAPHFPSRKTTITMTHFALYAEQEGDEGNQIIRGHWPERKAEGRRRWFMVHGSWFIVHGS